MKRRHEKMATNRPRHRVFIFGAGVSASCGIPVAKDILRQSISRLSQKNSAAASLVQKLLRYLYPNFDERLMNYPNIEDFLNLLEMARQFNSEEFIASTTWPDSRLRAVKDITLRAVTDCIWQLIAEKDRQRPVDDFVRDHLRPRDTLITFNWDAGWRRPFQVCDSVSVPR